MKSKRQITCEMVGVSHARKCNSFDEVMERIYRIYPNAHPHGSALGWSWVDNEGIVVAASSHILSGTLGRHWLAIRPKENNSMKTPNVGDKVRWLANGIFQPRGT